MEFRGYQYYIWVYILGAVLTLANGMFFHNTLLLGLCLVALYCILFYKGIHILLCYKKTDNRYPPIDRGEFAATYRTFRVRVALFWLAFIVLCLIGKFILFIDPYFFYCCTFFFLFLDRWFVNAICLLQKFSDPKGATVLCCCSCPCRGWDLMMIHTPLLFALTPQWGKENVLIILSSILGLLSLICWEIHKYRLVEVRAKCAKSCDLKACREHQR